MTKDVDMQAPKWFIDAVDKEIAFIDRVMVDGSVRVYGCSIRNSGAWQKAKIGDYIVKGVTGDIFPCKEEVFCKTYQYIDGKEVEPMSCKGKGKGKGGKKGKGK
ncbi:MAG: hypothetical protein ACI4EO_01605 [Blautia sp.]